MVYNSGLQSTTESDSAATDASRRTERQSYADQLIRLAKGSLCIRPFQTHCLADTLRQLVKRGNRVIWVDSAPCHDGNCKLLSNWQAATCTNEISTFVVVFQT